MLEPAQGKGFVNAACPAEKKEKKRKNSASVLSNLPAEDEFGHSESVLVIM